MNLEDQVAALFAEANPVPSLDLLEPVESVDAESLPPRSVKSTGMTDLKAIAVRGGRRPRRRHWLAPALATVGVILANALLFNVTPLANAAPAVGVANAFMDALNEHDGLAIRGMYALEDQELKWNPDLWVAVTELNQALGFEYTDVDCAERPPISYAGTETTPVECSWTLQQDLIEALELEASEGTYTVYVTDEEIVRVVETWRESSSMNESFDEFRSWVQQSHPSDVWYMYSSPLHSRLTALYADDYVVIEPESLELWEQYVDEFVAEHEG